MKELSSCFFCLCCFIFDAVLSVYVPLSFGVLGRMWNLTASVPDHCILIYFVIAFTVCISDNHIGKLQQEITNLQVVARLRPCFT